jgi:MFS family permease
MEKIWIGLFIIGFFVHEKKKEKIDIEANPIKFSLKAFDGNFKRFLVVMSIFTLSNSTDAFLLLRAQQSGIAPAVLPLLWMVLHFSKVLSSLAGGNLSDRFGRKGVIVAGWLLYAVVYVMFAFINAPWQAWALFVVYGAFFGLTEGVEKALVADMVEDEKRGTAYGLSNLAYGITVFPASLLFGFLWTRYGVETAFIVSACISIIAAILFLGIKTKKLDEAPTAIT